ncbi:serine hydrolase [Tenacibaculum sp. 190524A02b]|uniref:TPR_REGION domain-containing protein n=1 Tax=Tenacibaculum vairaonense TaxID=3137860 RepID=A0ABM9PRK4_9FLAO
MKIINHILVCILFTTFSTTYAQLDQDDIVLKQKIDTYLTKGVSQGFSGVVLVSQKEKIILHKAYGLSNKETNTPYQTTTVSTIGSVTKQFTATAILKLVMLNKLKVEDSINKFFPNLPNDKKNITIHQLLTHSSGFKNGVGKGDFDYIPTEKYFNSLFTQKLLFTPGSNYKYSNAGYSILARIIEIVSEMEYESFLNEYLFQPAGMKNTGYFIPDWSKHTIASGYAYNIFSLGTLIARFKKHQKISWNLKGNGGIHATTEDMYKWYKALKANKILTKDLFQKLTTPYIAEVKDKSSYYAYGWAINTSKKGTKIISHNGGNRVFFHEFIWLPKEDIVIILFTNASSREVEVAWPIQKMILDKKYIPNPIKKNLHFLIQDFIKNNNVNKVNTLISMITKNYRSQIRNANKLNDIGYLVLNQELIKSKESTKWAIALFKLNTVLFPANGNIWDSLGEAYIKNKQKERAKESYLKALELAPTKNCDWCESSSNALKKLKQN